MHKNAPPTVVPLQAGLILIEAIIAVGVLLAFTVAILSFVAQAVRVSDEAYREVVSTHLLHGIMESIIYRHKYNYLTSNAEWDRNIYNPDCDDPADRCVFTPDYTIQNALRASKLVPCTAVTESDQTCQVYWQDDLSTSRLYVFYATSINTLGVTVYNQPTGVRVYVWHEEHLFEGRRTAITYHCTIEWDSQFGTRKITRHTTLYQM